MGTISVLLLVALVASAVLAQAPGVSPTASTTPATPFGGSAPAPPMHSRSSSSPLAPSLSPSHAPTSPAEQSPSSIPPALPTSGASPGRTVGWAAAAAVAVIVASAF